MTSELRLGVRSAVSDEEWAVREDLAACYRIVDMLGWTSVIYNHISARVPGRDDRLLINPFGLGYDEVTASNLVTIDLDGQIVGPSDWPVNHAGVVIHTAVHAARQDVGCVMHTHTIAGSAVASLAGGLDRNNFYGASLEGRIAYHDFEGITVERDEQERLVRDLGHRDLMILRNHGLLACGPDIPITLRTMWSLEEACRIQLAVLSTGNPVMEITDAVAARSSGFKTRNLASGGPTIGDHERTFFDALRRRVDRIDTGYRH